MTSACSTPVTAAQIDDLFGSAPAVATVIYGVWPDRFLRQRLMHRPIGPGIAPWHWKAIFRATCPSQIKNSTPSPAYSAKPCISFWRAPNRLDPVADGTPPSFTSSGPLPSIAG
jgi:hypothetical protein